MTFWKLDIELYNGDIDFAIVVDENEQWVATFPGLSATDTDPPPPNDLVLRRAFDFLESQTDKILITTRGRYSSHPKPVQLPLEDMTLQAILDMTSIPRWYVYRKIDDTRGWHRRSGPFYDEEQATLRYSKCRKRVTTGAVRLIQATDDVSTIIEEEHFGG